MSRPGQPLRVLALAGLALPMWLALRVPELQRRYAAILAAMAPAEIIKGKSLRRPGPVAPDPIVVAGPVRPSRAPEITGRRVTDGHRLPTPVAVEPAEVPPMSTPVDRGPGPPAPAAKGPLPSPAFDLATRAYERLAAGNRRDAERLFAAALGAGPDAPQAAQWAAERRRLNQRWSGDAFMLFRDSGQAAGAAASPVLGGGQSGAMLGYAIDPVAPRPVAVFGRLYAAHDDRGFVDGASAQAALGVRWQVLPGVSIAAERLIAVGRATTGDWNLRVAAGGERAFGPAALDGYAEAGARGNGDLYAGGQAHAMLPVAVLGRVRVAAGPGTWGSIQTGFATVWRVDAGPGVAAALPGGVTVRAEWRWRVAGNAAPTSGPAATVGWSF